MNHTKDNLIDKFLPQKYPFVMIDKILEYSPSNSLVALKNITGNEWMFKNASNETLEFPQVMLIESASQAAAMFYCLSNFRIKENEKLVLGKIKAEIHESVSVGDQITLHVNSIKMFERMGIVSIKLNKNDIEIAKMEINYSKI